MIKDRFLLPTTDGSPTKPFKGGVHLGVDFGWTNKPYTNILSIDDGVVVDKFYSSTCGYSVVIQHNYSDGTHRWSGYIHLKQHSDLKIGDKVAQGDVVGIKGNSGNSNGVHLHIYVSDYTCATYSWNTMKVLCTFDPLPYMYRSKKYTYFGTGLNARPYLEDLPQPVEYPKPVERNEKVKQIEVLIDYLFMRKSPAGEKYDKFCTKGVYDVLSEQKDDSYTWYKIAQVGENAFWVASGGTRTKDLPITKDEVTVLKEKVEELNATVANLTAQIETLTKANETLTGAQKTLETEKENLNKKIEDAKGVLERD